MKALFPQTEFYKTKGEIITPIDLKCFNFLDFAHKNACHGKCSSFVKVKAIELADKKEEYDFLNLELNH